MLNEGKIAFLLTYDRSFSGVRAEPGHACCDTHEHLAAVASRRQVDAVGCEHVLPSAELVVTPSAQLTAEMNQADVEAGGDGFDLALGVRRASCSISQRVADAPICAIRVATSSSSALRWRCTSCRWSASLETCSSRVRSRCQIFLQRCLGIKK